jgi:dTDP-4-dehydrorhamnose 3,5-epimerase
MTSKFRFYPTSTDGIVLIDNSKFSDSRGSFVKVFNDDYFAENNIVLNLKESYYSVSQKNVLRGMHFQKYPFGHAKLVHVIDGEILDVVVGIGSPMNKSNKGKIFSTVLSSANSRSLFIPEGYAHGFLVLSEKAIVVNYMTSCFNEESDSGIHYNSFGFDWPVGAPIVSDKDKAQISFTQLMKLTDN